MSFDSGFRAPQRLTVIWCLIPAGILSSESRRSLRCTAFLAFRRSLQVGLIKKHYYKYLSCYESRLQSHHPQRIILASQSLGPGKKLGTCAVADRDDSLEALRAAKDRGSSSSRDSKLPTTWIYTALPIRRAFTRRAGMENFALSRSRCWSSGSHGSKTSKSSERGHRPARLLLTCVKGSWQGHRSAITRSTSQLKRLKRTKWQGQGAVPLQP